MLCVHYHLGALLLFDGSYCQQVMHHALQVEGSQGLAPPVSVMAISRTTVLGLILATLVLAPTASAWQEKLRTVTLTRIYISGALAAATLPAAYIPQAQDTVGSTLGNANTTPSDADGKTGRSSRDGSGFDVRLMCMLTFRFCIYSSVVSCAILSMPDEDAGVCLVDRQAYKFLRFFANLLFLLAIFTAFLATAVARYTVWVDLIFSGLVFGTLLVLNVYANFAPGIAPRA